MPIGTFVRVQLVNNIERITISQPENVVFLCDENTYDLCFSKLNSNFKVITLPAGEPSKTLEGCKYVWDELISFSADRSTHLWCLGGGMICDLGAFASSCFQRGIKFTLVPTSLLAMVDAATGGKSGVDYGYLKNYIGLFTEPEEIVICPEFLETLSEEEWINGKMEMIKHGLICSREHFHALKGTGVMDVSMIDLELIRDSIAIKDHHCEKDRFERGIRKRLNFGHTIGHAIESFALERGEPIAHGLAVALGMIAEAYLSYTDWSLQKDELDEVVEYLKPIKEKVDCQLFDFVDLYPYMLKDKKNQDQKIYCSLLSSIGNSQENLLISEEKVKEAIDFLKGV